MRRRAWIIMGLCGVIASTSPAWSKPPATRIMCEQYPQIQGCSSGVVECAMCHTVAPARNAYGEQLSSELAPMLMRPLSDEDFALALPDALRAIEFEDADDDGFDNLAELMAGTSPSDARELPRDQQALCEAQTLFTRYDVCRVDLDYVFRKVHLDFCGASPGFEEVRAFASAPDRRATITQTLEACLDSEFWRGKNGEVWQLANAKINPVQSLKHGEDGENGLISFGDYYDDYQFFVYAHTDGRDVRDLLLGDYFVSRIAATPELPTQYLRYNPAPLDELRERGFNLAQFTTSRTRAGMITHRWFLVSTIMISGAPRSAPPIPTFLPRVMT